MILTSQLVDSFRKEDNITTIIDSRPTNQREETMSEEKYREILKQFHEQLQDTEPLDEETREMLTHIENDIQQILKQKVKNPSTVHRSLNDQLDEAVGSIENSYPDLAETMRRIMTTLANMGI